MENEPSFLVDECLEEINNDHVYDPVYETDQDYLQTSYLQMDLQTDFQDEIISTIFNDIIGYIGEHALPICEYVTCDDVECIIEDFL